jgi:heme oxygenase
MPHSWMIERLNRETRPHHADADADFDLPFRQDATAAHYLTFLIRTYGFEAPLESVLSATPKLDRMIDLRERHRAGLLAQDLLSLGLRPSEVAELPQCLTIPQFRGAAEALGWMYVVERATLTHSVIRRHLWTRLPREMNRASSYLESYSGLVGKRWREFGTLLDEVARLPAIADRIVASAGDAFRTQRRWIAHEHQDTRVAV